MCQNYPNPNPSCTRASESHMLPPHPQPKPLRNTFAGNQICFNTTTLIHTSALKTWSTDKFLVKKPLCQHFRYLWHCKVHYREQKSPLLYSVLRHSNWQNIVANYLSLFIIDVNYVSVSTLRFPRILFSSGWPKTILLACKFLSPDGYYIYPALIYLSIKFRECFCIHKTWKLNSLTWVRERTVPTEWPPLVGEVSVNFCG
jgi:hypothetical protein